MIKLLELIGRGLLFYLKGQHVYVLRALQKKEIEVARGNPSFKALVNYAHACGFKLDLGFKHA